MLSLLVADIVGMLMVIENIILCSDFDTKQDKVEVHFVSMLFLH